MLTKNRRLFYMVSAVFLILLAPLVAMQFTQEVNWTIGDFIVAATILFGTVSIIELLLRIVAQPKVRVVLVIGAILLLLLVWVELAVGIF